MEEPQESCNVQVVRVDDFAERRYRVHLTVTVRAESLAEAVEAGARLIGELP